MVDELAMTIQGDVSSLDDFQIKIKGYGPRYCTHEFYRGPRLINGELIKEWIFRYSDGTFEILKMRVPVK